MKIKKVALISLIGIVSCVSLASCGVKSKTFTNTSDSSSKIVGRDDKTASLTNYYYDGTDTFSASGKWSKSGSDVTFTVTSVASPFRNQTFEGTYSSGKITSNGYEYK